jgi:hypothetical protein
MGNTDTVLFSTNVAESRGGKISQAIIAPRNEIRHYTLRSLRKTQVSAFKALIRNNLGQLATITDDDSRIYRGTLFSDNIEIVCVNDNCSYDMEFDILCLPDQLDYILAEDLQILLTEDDQELLLEVAI